MTARPPAPCALLLAAVALVMTTGSLSAADRVTIADAAAMDLGRSLREALSAAMASAGPVAAVGFCHDEAPAIAREVAARHGVAIGRVGIRLRNPDNAAGDWQQAMLDDFAGRVAAGEAPEALRHATEDPTGGDLRYGRGIRTEGACLLCHGPAVAPAVAEAIAARYPQDRATGFAEGELRGAFWVEVPAPAR
jgi:hypothetical protein